MAELQRLRRKMSRPRPGIYAFLGLTVLPWNRAAASGMQPVMPKARCRILRVFILEIAAGCVVYGENPAVSA